MNELDLVREIEADVPPLATAARERTRRRLLQAAVVEQAANQPLLARRQVRRPRRGWRRMAVAGALTLATAAGFMVAQTVTLGGRPGQPPRPLAQGGVANAAAGRFAHQAMIAAATAPDPAPRADQWVYIKTVGAQAKDRRPAPPLGPSGPRETVEDWVPVVPKVVEVEAGGRGTLVDYSQSPYVYRRLLELPTDPAAMLAHIYGEVGGHDAGAFSRDEAAFEQIMSYMREGGMLPPRIRAALYGAAARIPGIAFTPKAVDGAGRRGVALSWVEDGWLRHELIINPKTFQYLGDRAVAVHDQPRPRPEEIMPGVDPSALPRPFRKGEVVSWSAQLRAAVVDRYGQRP